MLSTPIPFVIFAAPRSGSWHLVEQLNQHPNVVCNGELLNPDDGSWSSDDRLRLPTPDLLSYAFSELANRVPKSHVRAVGFKYLANQDERSGRPEFSKVLLGIAGLRAVILRRDNVVESLRSERQAEITGRWQQLHPDRGPMPTVRLSPEDVILYAQRINDYYRQLDEQLRATSTLRVTYEDLCAQPSKTLGAVTDFLGVKRFALYRPALYKQELRPLQATIGNIDELRQALRSTALARFVL